MSEEQASGCNGTEWTIFLCALFLRFFILIRNALQTDEIHKQMWIEIQSKLELLKERTYRIDTIVVETVYMQLLPEN